MELEKLIREPVIQALIVVSAMTVISALSIILGVRSKLKD